MDLMTKVSFGFDIATAISIIGAVFVFVGNLAKQKTNILREEQEAERVKQLIKVRKIIASYNREFMLAWGPGSSTSVEEKKRVLFHTHTTMIRLYQENMPIIPLEDLGHFILRFDMEKFNEARYLIKLIDLEKSMINRIRLIMNDETPTESEKAIDRYINYTYKGYSELKKKIEV